MPPEPGQCLKEDVITISISTQRVVKALDNTPKEYAESLFNMRSAYSKENAGSVLNAPPQKIPNLLRGVRWVRYPHPNIEFPAVGFLADIPGRVGIITLSDLDPQHPVVLEDPKGTGAVSAVVENVGDRIMVGHTTMILGPREDGQGEQVWTFHPGDPIRPSEVPASKAGISTVGEAVALGLEYAKVRS